MVADMVLNQKEVSEMFKRIGERIIYYRRLKEIRQVDLAAEAGISEQYLSRIERGEKSKGLSVYVLINIAKALDVKPSEIISRTE